MRVKSIFTGLLSAAILFSTIPVQAAEPIAGENAQGTEERSTEKVPGIVYEDESDYEDCDYVIHWNDAFGYMHKFGLNVVYDENNPVDQGLVFPVNMLSGFSRIMGFIPACNVRSAHIIANTDMTPYIDEDGKLKEKFFETDIYLKNKLNEGPNLANIFRDENTDRDIYIIMRFEQGGRPIVTREAGKLTSVNATQYVDIDFKPSFYYAQKRVAMASNIVTNLQLQNFATDYYYPIIFSDENFKDLPDGYNPIYTDIYPNKSGVSRYEVVYFTVTPKEGYEIESVTCDEAVSCKIVDEYYLTQEKTEGDIYELKIDVPTTKNPSTITINVNMVGMDNSPYENRTFFQKHKAVLPIMIGVCCIGGIGIFLLAKSKKKTMNMR